MSRENGRAEGRERRKARGRGLSPSNWDKASKLMLLDAAAVTPWTNVLSSLAIKNCSHLIKTFRQGPQNILCVACFPMCVFMRACACVLAAYIVFYGRCSPHYIYLRGETYRNLNGESSTYCVIQIDVAVRIIREFVFHESSQATSSRKNINACEKRRCYTTRAI